VIQVLSIRKQILIVVRTETTQKKPMYEWFPCNVAVLNQLMGVQSPLIIGFPMTIYQYTCINKQYKTFTDSLSLKMYYQLVHSINREIFLKRLSIREMHVASLTCGQKSGIFTTWSPMPFEKIIITIIMHGLPTGLLKVSFFSCKKKPSKDFYNKSAPAYLVGRKGY
jgi:hypothetical protein